MPKELRICEYNVENLFISMEYYTGQEMVNVSENEWVSFALSQFRRRQKPIYKVRGVAKAMLDIDADIFMLVEIGGAESIENFNRHFLEDRYTVHFISGNSRRNIDLAFLVKKDLPFQFETRSNREMPIEVDAYVGKYTAKFSRDVAELRISENAGLKLILLLTHLKSKISSDQDFRGTDVRTGEAIALARLYERIRREEPGTPIVLGGDFNSPLTSPEFDALRETDAIDFYDLPGSPSDDRATLVYIGYQGEAHAEILDYLLISPHLRNRILLEKSYTYRYKGFYDIPNELPTERKERKKMPSDHFPVVLTLLI